MERKLRYMINEWCPKNFLKICLPKTNLMAFGPLPHLLPKFEFNGVDLEFVDTYKYAGIHFLSTSRSIFEYHYEKKTISATREMYGILRLEGVMGDLAPQDAIQLYKARIDPHLIHGCEVAIDVAHQDLKKLESAQMRCLRRFLYLSKWSMSVILFTETGIMPIAYRRLTLVLRYIQYLLDLPDTRYAKAAFRDSLLLAQNGKASWLGDIKLALQGLPVPVPMETEDIASKSSVELLIMKVEESCARWLNETVENSPRLRLLHGRVKDSTKKSRVIRSGGPDETHQKITLKTVSRLRPHLTAVGVPAHRRALTRLVCGEHCLAIEKLRRKERHRDVIPREDRLCRFCKSEVEDEPHALLYCAHRPQSLLERTSALIKRAQELVPGIDWKSRQEDEYENVRMFLRHEIVIPAFAAHVFQVLKTFDETEIYIADRYKNKGSTSTVIL